MTTVIFASPRKNGFTAQLTDAFLSRAGGEINTVYIYSAAPLPCTACGECKQTYKCVINDLDEILRLVDKSDRLIIASPVYNYSVPAPLKAFFDRLQPFYEKGAVLPKVNKHAFLILTCGQSGKYSFDIIRRQCAMAFSLLGFNFDDELTVPFTDKNGLPAEFCTEAAQKAEKFFKSVFLEENL